MKEPFEDIREYAIRYNIPIIELEGFEKIKEIIKSHTIKNILEVGTAIGYSALCLNDLTSAKIDTFEREYELYQLALENIKNKSKENEIYVHNKDFLNTDLSKYSKNYDLIYIDGAKAQYLNFFKHCENKINDNTIVIFDNLNFHGIVFNEEKKKKASRNLRQLIRKIENFNTEIEKLEGYRFEKFNVGDGIGVLRRDL